MILLDQGAAFMNESDKNHHPSLLGQLALFAAAGFVLLVLVWTYVH